MSGNRREEGDNSLQDQVARTFGDDSAFAEGTGGEDQGGQDWSQGEIEQQREEPAQGDQGADQGGEDAQTRSDVPDFTKFLNDSERGAKANRPGRYEQDKRGNVVDPKTGQVLARSGAEARHYMDTHRARMETFQATRERDELRGHLQQAVGFIEQYRARLAGIEEANTMGQRLGLQPTEAVDAMQMMSRLKRGGADGLQALKEVLTRAAAAGIDVQSLGVGSGGIDVKSIVDQIRQEFQPIRQNIDAQRQATERDQQLRARQTEAWNNAADHTIKFFTDNPNAVPYAPQINQILNDPRYSGWSLREVWMALQLDQARRGSTALPGGGGRQPIPRGRPVVNGADMTGDQIAHPDMSYAELVNKILDEHGIQ